MCGISGVLAFKSSNFEVKAEYLLACERRWFTAAQTALVPGFQRTAVYGLAHRRLSIIDLSPAASQPMSNEDGSLQIVFNGEIYNHAEIRRELKNSDDAAGRRTTPTRK